MNYRILISPLCYEEIREIYFYISIINLQNVYSANKIVRQLFDKIYSLSFMPNRFKNSEIEGYRVTRSNSYLIFYQVNDNDKTVFISQIINVKQANYNLDPSN